MDEKKENGAFCTLPQDDVPRNGLPRSDLPRSDLPQSGPLRKKRPPTALEAGDGTGERIYGREGCPHTNRARRALPKAEFRDVRADPAALREMLALTGGVRRIPVIVRGGEVQIGFRRGS